MSFATLGFSAIHTIIRRVCFFVRVALLAQHHISSLTLILSEGASPSHVILTACYDCRAAACLLQRQCKASAMKLVSIAELPPVLCKDSARRAQCSLLRLPSCRLSYAKVAKKTDTKQFLHNLLCVCFPKANHIRGDFLRQQFYDTLLTAVILMQPASYETRKRG